VTASLLIAALLALRASGAAAESAGGAREPRDSTHTWPRIEYSDVRSAHDSTRSDTSIDAAGLGDSAVHRVTFSSVERWRAVLDRPDRDALEMTDRIVDSLRLSRGARVADIGAGTGYFERLLARAVGDSGRVYAEEIEPPLVAYLAERARSEGTPQVVPIYGAPADPRLPGDLDLIFLCNVYRYIDGRRAFFRRLLPNLARSGRVAIVDWRPTDNSPNRLPAQRVVAEMGAAGYRLIQEPTFLPKQYFLVFGRAEEPGPR